MPNHVISHYGKDILQSSDTASSWAKFLEMQCWSSTIAQQMIQCNSLANREIVKLKKAFETIEKERDQTIGSNMKLIDDVKKYEDR